VIIISDVHGCYNTFRRLLRKCPDEPLVLGGDNIDRGPRSAEMVRWIMDTQTPSVKGNHEDLMLGELGIVDHYDEGLWVMNGGGDAIKSWNGLPPNDVRKWAFELPYYLKFDNLLISHTGHGLAGDKPHGHLSALWHRDPQFPDDGLFRVFGHTPAKEPVITSSYAMIDTGCAYQNRGYGTLTALQWPSMQIFQQPYDESPL